MNIRILYILISISTLCQTSRAQDFNLYAISSEPAQGPFIALTWSDSAEVVEFDIFRRVAGESGFPSSPINTSRIRIMENCPEIANTLGGTGTELWNTLLFGLADHPDTLFSPCDVSQLVPETPAYEALMMLAQNSLPIAQIAGLGFIDNNVSDGIIYEYRIDGWTENGQRLRGLGLVSVTAGQAPNLSVPSNVAAEAGDARILLYWNEVPEAAGYRVYRSILPNILYKQINEGEATGLITRHINQDTLLPNQPGLYHFQHYNGLGQAVPDTLHDGTVINGPTNGTTYYFRIAAVDLLGHEGPLSGTISATPTDQTAPGVPTGVAVTPDEPNSRMNIRWEHVSFDSKGHLENPGVSSYNLYRYEDPDDPSVGGTLVLAGIAAPAAGIIMVEGEDASPDLRQDFGDKAWWYRVEAVDAAGNVGPRSTAVMGIMKDTTAPPIVRQLIAEGFEEFITLSWDSVDVPDIDGYQVFRSLCHYDEWIPCRDPNQRYTTHLPPTHIGIDYDLSKGEKFPDPRNEEFDQVDLPIACSGPFQFLGEISADSLRRALVAGNPALIDRSIPPGSPLCYAYWVKAKDGSGNLSGGWPIPWNSEKDEIVCERLRDRTAPEPAFVSGLYARDQAIRVEWIGPPTQDIRAYHLYRADQNDPTTYHWVGGMTVEQPPTPPQPLVNPYQPIAPADCALIPTTVHDLMSRGYYLDEGVDPRKIYNYKVVGIDHDGNEGELQDAIPISTFTYSTQLPDAPVIQDISNSGDPCGLTIAWTPVLQPEKHLGFVIYRSELINGTYLPLSDLVKENYFTDSTAVKGKTYFYKVILLDQVGDASTSSAPLSGSY